MGCVAVSGSFLRVFLTATGLVSIFPFVSFYVNGETLARLTRCCMSATYVSFSLLKSSLIAGALPFRRFHSLPLWPKLLLVDLAQ
ncbi:hypothetical protein BDV95DRAFT_560082 [Massariosphaeria phaeospora]|uniref:Uncharacterized protein n=1 Tax=Massariosphaeria phaeospora TaxID=100035 RepID=A0A7C8MBD2_9PLEO|nr:hypothetical protein BDV95DRAFT_560082 [Massariosphaeria phaeospora]